MVLGVSNDGYLACVKWYSAKGTRCEKLNDTWCKFQRVLGVSNKGYSV
jgi:hypothetical protein